jgi:Protein of unknown function (DUF3052)
VAEPTKPLLDRLGVKAGMRVAVVGIDDAWFLKMLRERTGDVVVGKPRRPCDVVLLRADTLGDLDRIRDAKAWIEPNGAIWVVRPKGQGSPIKDTDLISAGLRAGLVDNKIASYSETHGAMRFVFRLKDRPKP